MQFIVIRSLSPHSFISALELLYLAHRVLRFTSLFFMMRPSLMELSWLYVGAIEQSFGEHLIERRSFPLEPFSLALNSFRRCLRVRLHLKYRSLNILSLAYRPCSLSVLTVSWFLEYRPTELQSVVLIGSLECPSQAFLSTR